MDLTENTFEFSGTSNGEKYSVKIEFYKEVEKDSAKWHFLGKQASFVFHKQESGPFWPRLLKDSGRHTWLKADWDKWVDESDDDDGPAGDMFGDYDSMPDFSQYSGAGAGAGSDDDDDGDDGDSGTPGRVGFFVFLKFYLFIFLLTRCWFVFVGRRGMLFQICQAWKSPSRSWVNRHELMQWRKKKNKTTKTKAVPTSSSSLSKKQNTTRETNVVGRSLNVTMSLHF